MTLLKIVRLLSAYKQHTHAVICCERCGDQVLQPIERIEYVPEVGKLVFFTPDRSVTKEQS